ncbi:MAG: DNRLRE domain-containing protein [Flavobacteriales bacterium]
MLDRTTVFTLLVAPTLLHAQEVIQLYPSMDAAIGIHPGYASENTNYNDVDWFGAGSQPGNLGGENNFRALMAFDLSSFPAGTLIDDATLDLFGRGAVGLGDAASVGNIGDNAALLLQVIEPWSDNSVTWNTEPDISFMNGVVLPPSTQVIEDYIGIDVTNMVQAMIDDPTLDHGMEIRLITEDITRGLFFCGKDFPDPLKRPRLNIKPHEAVSIAEHGLSRLPLFPNPASGAGSIRISVPPNVSGGLIVVLVDPCGKLVEQTPVTAREGSIEMSVHPTPGIYTLFLRDSLGKSVGWERLVISGE